MSDTEDEGDKQFEPTQKKLDDARKKGEVAKSVDLTTAASYCGLLLVAAAFGPNSLAALGSVLSATIEFAPELAHDMFNANPSATSGKIGTGVLRSMFPWFVIPGVLALLCVIAQQSFVVAPSKLQPKLNRLSPISNAKNKFGRQGLFEFAKSFAKLMIISTILGMFLAQRTETLVGTLQLGASQSIGIMMGMAVDFLLIVLLVTAAIGTVDFMWQKGEHIRKHRMSRKELVDEAKQQEGDPHMKGQRRQRAQEIAMNQMLADVPTADVVIVNPTHFAVALTWSRMPGAAPECVAKGVDEIAFRIRDIAQAANVPIHSDPPTARALFAVVEIGREVHPDHYQAVAAAIKFADTMRAKSKSGGWS